MRLLFLPGAGASAAFWRPVADRLLPRDLPADARHRLFSWPGLGDEPHDPAVRGMDDLVAMVVRELDASDRPAALIAQSMGGPIAIRAALAAPGRVGRLVLTATSAGVPMADLGAADWRPEYRRTYPNAAPWITEPQPDLSPRLADLAIPTLLLWGDMDPISPPAVGRRLHGMLSPSRLHVVRGGDHDLAITHAAEITPHIRRHLA